MSNKLPPPAKKKSVDVAQTLKSLIVQCETHPSCSKLACVGILSAISFSTTAGVPLQGPRAVIRGHKTPENSMKIQRFLLLHIIVTPGSLELPGKYPSA